MNIRKQIIASSDPTWVRELKTQLNAMIDEFARIKIRGDGTTTRVEQGVVSAIGSDLPPITSTSQRHQSVVLELNEEMVTELELTEETKWQALYYKLGYPRLR